MHTTYRWLFQNYEQADKKNKFETSVGTTISRASLEHNKPAATAAAWPSCSTPPSSWERQLRLVRHPPATLLLVSWKKPVSDLGHESDKDEALKGVSNYRLILVETLEVPYLR